MANLVIRDEKNITVIINSLQDTTLKDTQINPLYTIKAIDGKNQGCVATCKITAGTRILAEAPLFTIPPTPLSQNLESVIVKRLKALDTDQKRAFLSLYNAHRDKSSPFHGIMKTNMLPLGAGSPEGGIFLEASRINHACNPNAQNTWNKNLDQITIHSIKDIEEGEEITISYLADSINSQRRQKELKNSFGFDCTCQVCSLPSALRHESDRRNEEIARLDEIIGGGVTIVSAPLSCLNSAHKLLDLLKEEDITDARVARLWYDAFQIAIANGDEARAKVFAERAYAERVLVEGKDSPDTALMKHYAEMPANHRLYGTTMKWRQPAKKIPKGLSEEEFENWLWKTRNKKA
jgi:hypothetical protein